MRAERNRQEPGAQLSLFAEPRQRHANDDCEGRGSFSKEPYPAQSVRRQPDRKRTSFIGRFSRNIVSLTLEDARARQGPLEQL